jgi:hypothetical protein
MVAVLDAWTSPPSDETERIDTFATGETIQFNGLFKTEREYPTKVGIIFVITSVFSKIVYCWDDFDVITRPETALEAEFVVGPAAQRPYAIIPIVPPEIDFVGREETAVELAKGGFNITNEKDTYTFRVGVKELDIATGLRFDISDPWTYRIV